MNCCPITYAFCEGLYSPKGLKLLSRNLIGLENLPFSSLELRQEASARAGKISIQGVQPKLSARINIKKQIFEIVNKGGHYILKPQISDFEQVPENEDLTMRMAAIAGIEVPLHGMIYGRDNELTYFIRRFDRSLRNQKTHAEDFAQLAGKTRDTKYNSSMEQVVKIIDEFCTFPAVEKLKLFKIVLFCFLVGNEDMHLKNFSIIRNKDIITLSPSYDLLNTSIVLPDPTEELALPLNGKKNRIKKQDLINYFGSHRLGLTVKVISRTLADLEKAQIIWSKLIENSFLKEKRKTRYKDLIHNRGKRLF
ncbi:MAG: HipA domain-containing protein [Desulfobacula sp.]|jgi:serine/threonine-protein kinase HipA|nr:HipA domain-containing protein [Desulfobacula sp.]